MKTLVFCEGTTDLLMLQFLLQYKYGWKYDGFVENTVTNRLIKRKLIKHGQTIDINSCGGIANIPQSVLKLKEVIKYATKNEEIYNRVIVMIDHDTVDSNQKFIDKVAHAQTRYLQKKSNVSKAVFNTYFSIRAPEEKHDERARILNAYDWKNNEVLNRSFSFLDI